MIRSRTLRALAVLAVCLGLALTSGCATRARRHSIIDKTGMQVDLVRYVKGFRTEPQGFEHPAIISSERLTHILGAIEIETTAGTKLVLSGTEITLEAPSIKHTANGGATELSAAGFDAMNGALKVM